MNLPKHNLLKSGANLRTKLTTTTTSLPLLVKTDPAIAAKTPPKGTDDVDAEDSRGPVGMTAEHIDQGVIVEGAGRQRAQTGGPKKALASTRSRRIRVQRTRYDPTTSTDKTGMDKKAAEKAAKEV